MDDNNWIPIVVPKVIRTPNTIQTNDLVILNTATGEIRAYKRRYEVSGSPIWSRMEIEGENKDEKK